jgi:MFS family permease
MNRRLLAALLLASAQAPLGSTLVAVALPAIANGLGDDTVHATTLLVSSYLVITILFQGPGGRLSDALGHERTLWTGIGLFALGSCVGLVSSSVWLLAVARAIMAIGGALVVPSTMALLRVMVRPEHRGRIFGVFGSVMALSAALGPVIGGEVVEWFGWRATFLVSLPFLAVAAVLLRLDPPPAHDMDSTKDRREGFRSLDFNGLAMLAVALVLITASAKLDGMARLGGLLAGLVAGTFFFVRQWRAEQPVLDVRLLREPVMAGATAIMALQNFAMYGLIFQLPAFFEHFRGTAPRAVGFSLFTMMIGMVVASPIGGRATDRLGARTAGLIGAAVLVVGSLALCRLQSFSTPTDAVPYLVVFGLGMGLSSAPAQSSAMAAVPSNRAGTAAGLSSTMRYLGGIATIAVQAAVLGGDMTVTEGSNLAMVVLYTAAALLSLGAATVLPRHARSMPEPQP